MVGSPETGLSLAANLVVRTGVSASSLDYRLAPEAPFPARITLRVTHAANTGSPSTVIFDKTDLAEAYWFADVNVTPGNSGSVVSCPTGSSASDAP